MNVRLMQDMRTLRTEHARLTKELDGYKSGDIHTCHEECQRPMCILTRERDALKAALVRIQSTAGHPDAAEGCRLVIKIAQSALSGENSGGGE